MHDSELFDPFMTQVERLVPLVVEAIELTHGSTVTWKRQAPPPEPALTVPALRNHALHPPDRGLRQEMHTLVVFFMHQWKLDVCKSEITGTDRRFSMREDGAATWPYVAAAVLLVLERTEVKPMKCMSCKTVDLKPENTKLFRKMMLCTGCNAMAEKAKAEIDQRINRAKDQALNWLDQHVMRGGLLAGGTGDGEGAHSQATVRSTERED